MVFFDFIRVVYLTGKHSNHVRNITMPIQSVTAFKDSLINNLATFYVPTILPQKTCLWRTGRT
jgi:hypothetical protein